MWLCEVRSCLFQGRGQAHWFKTTTFEGSFWAILSEFGRSRTRKIERYFCTEGGQYYLMILKGKAHVTNLITQKAHNYAKKGTKIEDFLPFFDFP